MRGACRCRAAWLWGEPKPAPPKLEPTRVEPTLAAAADVKPDATDLPSLIVARLYLLLIALITYCAPRVLHRRRLFRHSRSGAGGAGDGPAVPQRSGSGACTEHAEEQGR